jgi:prepilin-type N-terminal cleavage/methylation domain-containing protein
MLHPLRRWRQGEREGGFTLIELMVVVLIIAILIAIAIPTFLGARSRAQDRAAQASLRNALVAAKSIHTDSQDYSKAVKTSASNDPLKNVELPAGERRLDRPERHLRRLLGIPGDDLVRLRAVGLRHLLLHQGRPEHRHPVRVGGEHGLQGLGRQGAGFRQLEIQVVAGGPALKRSPRSADLSSTKSS